MSNVSATAENLRLFADRIDGLDEDILTAESVDLIGLTDAVSEVGVQLTLVENKVNEIETGLEEHLEEDDEDIEGTDEEEDEEEE